MRVKKNKLITIVIIFICTSLIAFTGYLVFNPTKETVGSNSADTNQENDLTTNTELTEIVKSTSSVCGEYSVEIQEGENIYLMLQSLKGSEYDLQINLENIDPSQELPLGDWQLLAFNINYNQDNTPAEESISKAIDAPVFNIDLDSISSLTEEDFMKRAFCGAINASNLNSDSEIPETANQDLDFDSAFKSFKESGSYLVYKDRYDALPVLIQAYSDLSRNNS